MQFRPDLRARAPDEEPDGLARGAERGWGGWVAAQAASESVDTAAVVAGFGGSGGGQTVGRPPVRRTGIPAAFKYALAVSRRTPVACSIRRSDQPSRPSARTCCCVCSLKTLLMSGEGPEGPRRCQRLGSLRVVAGFQVSISGRFWVSTEARGAASRHAQSRALAARDEQSRHRRSAQARRPRAPERRSRRGHSPTRSEYAPCSSTAATSIARPSIRCSASRGEYRRCRLAPYPLWPRADAQPGSAQRSVEGNRLGTSQRGVC